MSSLDKQGCIERLDLRLVCEYPSRLILLLARLQQTTDLLRVAQDRRSVLGSVSSVIDEIRLLENENRSVSKKFRNQAFQFSIISVRFQF
jgi:hypothetical protein